MAKVAIDISSTAGGHAVRGIGAYTRNLVGEYKKGKWPVEFEFFTSPTSPPPASLIHYPYFDLFFHTLPVRKTTTRGVTIHDVIPLVFPKASPVGMRGRLAHLLQKKALKNTDFVICDSQNSKRDVEEKLGVSPDKIEVIYLAASESFKKINDQKLLEHSRIRLKLPEKFVLYVGDVNWNKNIRGLLMAVSKIKTPTVLVGSALTDPNLGETKIIDEQIRKNNLSEIITKTGFLEEADLALVYNLAAATVLPSFYEGFGLPVLESMSCGTPVICSNIASLAEIAGDAAVFCNPHDPADIAEKIRYVMSLSQDGKNKLSQKSQKNASKYSWTTTAQKTVQIYQKYLRD